jgi:hypothetical protein
MAGVRRLLKLALLLIVLGLGAVAWDVDQLRGLRPPPDATFESFSRAGSYRIDESRIYWIAPPPRTILPHAAPPVYAFDRRGALVDWTPGAEPGMRSGSPLRPRGREATREQARAWLTTGR